MSVTEAAWGIHSVVNENMAGAARAHIIERGHDPRRYPLVAFGGAGPAHACRIARAVGAPEVILPPVAGAISALGFLVAPISYDFSRSYPIVLDELDWARLNRLFDEMAERGARFRREAAVSAGDIWVTRSADMRLVGQFHEITVPVPSGELGTADLGPLKAAFEAEFRRRYSHVYEGSPIMALTWRTTVAGPRPRVAWGGGDGSPATGPGGDHARKGYRTAYFPEAGGSVSVPAYARYLLRPGDEIRGPAIAEEREATAVIGPDTTARVDSYLNLIVDLRGAAPAAGAR